MGTENPETRLTKGIAEVSKDNIDHASDFPTSEAIDYQLYLRILGDSEDGYGLPYFKMKADEFAILMRAYQRKERVEMVNSYTRVPPEEDEELIGESRKNKPKTREREKDSDG